MTFIFYAYDMISGGAGKANTTSEVGFTKDNPGKQTSVHTLLLIILSLRPKEPKFFLMNSFI
jgi:hypothetical protein